MGKLEFIYKRNEFKFKEQIALSLFKTQGRWVVCFLNYHVVLSSEFLLLTNKRKTLPMARSISNGLFDSHCGLFHYTMSHIFFLCQLQRLKKKIWWLYFTQATKSQLLLKVSLWLLSPSLESLPSFTIGNQTFPRQCSTGIADSVCIKLNCMLSSLLEFSPIFSTTTIYLVFQTRNLELSLLAFIIVLTQVIKFC